MIVLQNMGGIAPMMTPASLSDRLAQTAENLVLYKGGVTPLKDAVTVATPTKSGVKKTIYRYEISQPESQYWFSWTTLVGLMPSWMLALLCLLYIAVVYHNFTELAK